MTRTEMVEIAETIRKRDKFGVMAPEDAAALAGTETRMEISRLGFTVPVLKFGQSILFQIQLP